MQTRQKFKESYDLHLAATIERAEKQILLANQARRLVSLLDDTPLVPGDARPAFEGEPEARQILADAEDELRAWKPSYAPIPSQAGHLNSNAMPGQPPVATEAAPSVAGESVVTDATAPVETEAEVEAPTAA